MLDIFEILGPVMIGPSSSHTAGAAKIGAMARTLLGAPPVRAAIHLYGSFAETGAGHGTDRALVGGLLGMKPDDPRLPDAFAEAEKAGLTYTIDEIKLRDAHPNTAVIEAKSADGRTLTMQASSIGGGRIMVNKLDGIDVNFNRSGHHQHTQPAARQRSQHESVPPQAGRRRADGHRVGSAPQAQPGGVSVRAAGRAVHDLLRQGGG